MKKLTLSLLAAALVVLAACAPAPGESGEGLSLYFASTEDAGAALVPVEYTGAEEPGVRQLMSALLAGPEGAGRTSAVPSWVTLRGCRLEDGVLYLDLSENYGGLSGVDLTLADYAITLTLSQLPGVEGVRITADGEPLSYRSHQILTSEEALLWAEEP